MEYPAVPVNRFNINENQLMGGLRVKSLEIKRISIGSVFKFYFVFGVVFGLIASIVLLLTGVSLRNTGIHFGSVDFGRDGPIQVWATLVGIVISTLAYGFLIALGSSIAAFLYNVFASVTGGVIVKVNEDG